MGYRSDVAYAIRFKTKEHRIRFMAVQFMREWIKSEEFSILDDTTILYDGGRLKWYPEFEDVQQHMQLIEDAKEQDCAWVYCRVGEDIGDIEQDGGDGTDDYGNDIDAPDILYPTQTLCVEHLGEPYPIGETLDTP